MKKRAFDLAVSVPLFIIALPFVALICIAVSLETRGAPIFRQTRLGKNEKPFSLYKIRTMYVGTGDHPTHVVGGEYITKIGKVLRKTKLDELPQLGNVIRGEMSLVGPRPGLPSQNTLASVRRENHIFDVAPGITGLAQVNGIDMSTHEKLAIADQEYIQRRDAWLDLQILFSTFVRTKAPTINAFSDK